MNTVKDLLKEHDLFSIMNELHPLPFGEDVTPELVTTMYIIQHGNRTLSSVGKNTNIATLSEVINTMYSDKWNKLYKAFIEEIPFQYDYRKVTTEKVQDIGGVDNTTTSDIEDTTNIDVTAYNEDDFVNANREDRKSKNTTFNKQDTDNLRERELTTEGTNSNIVSNYNKYIQYIKTNFIYEIIFEDVNHILTLGIF